MTRRLLPGLLVACLLAFLTATPAHADRVDRVTAALRQSPLFVDPDVSYLLNADERAALGKQIGSAGVPVYVAVVPLVSADESDGEGDYLAYLLHQRLGKPGIYVVASQESLIDWRSYQVPRDDTLSYALETGDRPLPQRLHDVVDAFAKAPSAKPSDPAPPRRPDTDERDEKPSNVKLVGEFFKAFALSVLLGGLALLLLWLLGALVFAIWQAVRGSTAQGPSRLKRRRLRRTATSHLVRLAKALGESGDNAGQHRAMADYDAAKLLYDEQDDAGSLFGVVALSLDGQDALRDKTAHPPARCLLNPFHGPAAGKTRGDLPGLPKADWPLCKTCRRAGKKGRHPLMVETGEGMLPYYQVPGLWEKIRGKSHDLPQRVLEYLGVE